MDRDNYLTASEFARAIGVTELTVYTWLKHGHPVHGNLLYIRPVRDYLIDRKEVKRLFSPLPPKTKEA